MTDAEAVAAIRAGNQEALAVLVERYGGAMAALAYDRLGTVAEAQDAVQECWLTCISKIESLSDPERFAAWNYEILRNICAMRLRSRGADSRATERLSERVAGEQPLTPLERVVAGEESLALRKAVESLSPPLREMVILRYLGGVDRPEVAAMLGLSLAAADKRLERALRELRETLNR